MSSAKAGPRAVEPDQHRISEAACKRRISGKAEPGFPAVTGDGCVKEMLAGRLLRQRSVT